MKTTPAETKIEHAEKLARAVVAEQTALNVKIVADAVMDATKLIASANESAVKLIASNAAESAKVLLARGNDDHDLLVKLGTRFDDKMEMLEKSIKELKDGAITDIKSHDSRLDRLESWRVTLDGKDGAAARFTTIENANLAFSTQVKTWIAAAGLVCTLIAFLASKFLGG